MKTTAIVVLALSGLIAGCERSPQAAPLAGSNGTSRTAVAAADHAAADGSRIDGEKATSINPAVAPANAAAASSSNAAAPAFREVTLPAGTRLPIVLDTPVASDTSRVEQSVRAHIARPVVLNGMTVLPAGSPVSGVVTSAVRSGKVKGRAHVAVRFDSVTRRGDSERYRIAASQFARTAPATKKEDTLKVVAPAAGGAVIGRIAGGRKGAAIGTAVGAGAGGAVVASTRGKEVRLVKGSLVTVRLSAPLTVRVPKG
jgi:hypothetical protein